jgi:hypothetical protein
MNTLIPLAARILERAGKLILIPRFVIIGAPPTASAFNVMGLFPLRCFNIQGLLVSGGSVSWTVDRSP